MLEPTLMASVSMHFLGENPIEDTFYLVKTKSFTLLAFQSFKIEGDNIPIRFGIRGACLRQLFYFQIQNVLGIFSCGLSISAYYERRGW
jgi:hypothetical protein